MVVKSDPSERTFRTKEVQHKAEVIYRIYKQAKHVWKQLGEDERAFILQQLGYRDAQKALDRDKKHDLAELRITDKQLRFIRDYPRSEHRRLIYKKLIASRPPVRDVFVSKHIHRVGKEREKQLREIAERGIHMRRRQSEQPFYVRGVGAHGRWIGARGLVVNASSRAKARAKFKKAYPTLSIVLVHEKES